MKLVIALAQMKVVQKHPDENLARGERLIAEAAGRGSGLVVLPEMWTTGFDWAYNGRLVASRDCRAAIDAVAAMAKRHRVWVAGSMLAPSPAGRCANAAFLFSPSGDIAARYGKIHLFGPIREDAHVHPGDALGICETPWGRTGLAVCYDIRFPELFLSYALKGARLIIVSAAFPRPKLHHWRTLLAARAIEDQVFIAAANQVGTEDLGASGTHTYVGHSMAIDPWGEIVAEAGETDEELLVAAIDPDRVDAIRGQMPVLRDRRPDLYDLE